MCSESDRDHVRLAVAKSFLRLARRWDSYISPPIFHLVILMARVCKCFLYDNRRLFCLLITIIVTFHLPKITIVQTVLNFLMTNSVGVIPKKAVCEL